MLPDVVEEAHGVVLHHHVVRGERLLSLVDPLLDYIPTALGTEVLGERKGGEGRRK